MKRRTFLEKTGSLLGLSMAGGFPRVCATEQRLPASERIRVAVIGVNGRGNNLLRTFASKKEVEIASICDVDSRVLNRRVSETKQGGRHDPAGLGDFRKAIDDKSIDAIVLGTPDHWHAIPSIYACMAGKDVYTEKPDSHNILESCTMAAAARKHKRVVQMGTQARSGPHMKEANQYISSGALGKVRYATAWESMKQGNLGRPANGKTPAGVDYDMWLGPAPKRPFNRLRFHGNWRWFFDYGTGDVGNDGVHRIDYARWALQTGLEAQGEKLPDLPRSVSATGGKFYFNDAQEWPDTLMANFDYGNCLLTYEMRIWSPYKLHGEAEGAAVYGDKGYVILANGRWRAFRHGGALVKESSGGSNLDQTSIHVQDFLDCMKSREKPAADLVTVGHPSSMLCHLANASWRSGLTLQFDPATTSFKGNRKADPYLGRAEYRAPWKLPKLSEL